MAGIKKGGLVGDEPCDFEKPATARAGVRMHINHMAAYTGKRPIGKPHNRFYDARAAPAPRAAEHPARSTAGSGCTSTTWPPTRARGPSANPTTVSTTPAPPRRRAGTG